MSRSDLAVLMVAIRGMSTSDCRTHGGDRLVWCLHHPRWNIVHSRLGLGWEVYAPCRGAVLIRLPTLPAAMDYAHQQATDQAWRQTVTNAAQTRWTK